MGVSGGYAFSDIEAVMNLRPSDLGASYRGSFCWQKVAASLDMDFYNTSDGHNERNGPCLKFGPLPNLAGPYIGAWLMLGVKEKEDADDDGAWDSDLGAFIHMSSDISWTESSSFANSPYSGMVFTGRGCSFAYPDVSPFDWLFVSADRAASELAGVDYWYEQNDWNGFPGLSIVFHRLNGSQAWADEDGKLEVYTGDSPNKSDSVTFYPRGSIFWSPSLWIATERHNPIL